MTSGGAFFSIVMFQIHEPLPEGGGETTFTNPAESRYWGVGDIKPMVALNRAQVTNSPASSRAR